MILLHKTIAEHETKVSSQEIFHVQNGNFMVTENIDTQMNEALKNFFIKGNIAINHIFPLSKFMGCNISFIREKEDTKFEQNAAKFLSQVPAAKKLVEMLRKDRGTWFLCFLNFRDKIEHKSPQRLMVQYSLQGDKVYAQFPLIDDIGLVDLIVEVRAALTNNPGPRRSSGHVGDPSSRRSWHIRSGRTQTNNSWSATLRTLAACSKTLARPIYLHRACHNPSISPKASSSNQNGYHPGSTA
jgi:hypothetical protein